jgi:hypothetical protein
MRSVTSIFTQSQALIPTGSRAVESMIADVNRCWRSDNGPFGRSNPLRNTDGQVRLRDVAGAFRRPCG